MATTAEEVSFKNPKGLLRFLIDYITWAPEHILFVHGAHVSSSTSNPLSTDFDFTYYCTRHIHTGNTYVVIPGSSLEQFIDIPTLITYVNKLPDKEVGAFDFDYITRTGNVYKNLHQWARNLCHHRSNPSEDRAGISMTRTFLSYPTPQHIEALAQKVGYCGDVSSNLYHEDSEPKLFSIGGHFTPASANCLHVRTAWGFLNASVTDENVEIEAAEVESVPQLQWETTVSQAMLGGRTGLVKDEEYVQRSKIAGDEYVVVDNELDKDWEYPLWGFDEWKKAEPV